MNRILLFNKPYGVICKFSRDGLHPTLADYIALPGFYPAGRLDMDSEGLLLLTDDGKLQQRIIDPRAQGNSRKLAGLAIREGKNRRVRRMTAAVCYPTLRLMPR